MKNKKNVIHLLSQLVAIDSRSSKDNTPIISLVTSWFSEYQTEIQSWIRDIDDVKGQNGVVKIPGMSSAASLVFICHLDTVPPNENWETDPFILEEHDARLYGLGSCDTKGGIAALIEAIYTLDKKPAYDTYLVFDGDEEETSVGIQRFLQKCSIKNPVFIAIEPTEREVHTAQRSIMKLRVTTYGTAQHSSKGTPENNEKYNAISKMFTIMELLSTDAQRLSREQDDLLGTNTQNFGMIQGGTAINVFAQKCTLSFERRMLPNYDLSKEVSRIRKLIRTIDSHADIQSIGALEPAFVTDTYSLFPQQVLSLTQSIIPQAKFGTFSAWSEAGVVSSKGPAVILGPGSLKGQAHKANEYIEISELFAFIHVYKKIIEDIRLS